MRMQKLLSCLLSCALVMSITCAPAFAAKGDVDTSADSTDTTDTSDTADTTDTSTDSTDSTDDADASSYAYYVTVPEDAVDGTYVGYATCYHDEDEEFSDYAISVSVVVSDGVITSVVVSGATSNDLQYSQKAESGVADALVGATAGSTTGIDVVSTATCSTTAIVEAINEAFASNRITSVYYELGDAIYDAEGTTFTLTVHNPEDGVDYSDIGLAYSLGKFSSSLTVGTDYSYELVSSSDDAIVYAITILGTSSSVDDDSATIDVVYNSVGRSLAVTVTIDGEAITAGNIVIYSGATVTIEENTLTITGGNGENLADYISAIGALTVSYTDKSTKVVVATEYTTQLAHDVAAEVEPTDLFDSTTGALNFDVATSSDEAVFPYGSDYSYTIGIENTGYNDVSATIGTTTDALYANGYEVGYAAGAAGSSAADTSANSAAYAEGYAAGYAVGKAEYDAANPTVATTAKKAQSIKVTAKKASTVKYSKLKKKAQVVKASKLYKVTGAKGTLSYSKVSVKKNGKKASKKVAKKITVSKTGKITLKKGLAKGTYKVKVKVKAAATSKYKASKAKTVTVTIKVK